MEENREIMRRRGVQRTADVDDQKIEIMTRKRGKLIEK